MRFLELSVAELFQRANIGLHAQHCPSFMKTLRVTRGLATSTDQVLLLSFLRR